MSKKVVRWFFAGDSFKWYFGCSLDGIVVGMPAESWLFDYDSHWRKKGFNSGGQELTSIAVDNIASACALADWLMEHGYEVEDVDGLVAGNRKSIKEFAHE